MTSFTLLLSKNLFLPLEKLTSYKLIHDNILLFHFKYRDSVAEWLRQQTTKTCGF